jgi:hypothetical protein
VLADGGGGFLIKLIEGYDAVEAAAAGHVAHGVEKLLGGEVFRHEGDVFEDVAGPVGIAELFYREEGGAYAHLGALAKEVLSFFVGGDTENPLGCVAHPSLVALDLAA